RQKEDNRFDRPRRGFLKDFALILIAISIVTLSITSIPPFLYSVFSGKFFLATLFDWNVFISSSFRAEGDGFQGVSAVVLAAGLTLFAVAVKQSERQLQGEVLETESITKCARVINSCFSFFFLLQLLAVLMLKILGASFEVNPNSLIVGIFGFVVSAAVASLLSAGRARVRDSLVYNKNYRSELVAMEAGRKSVYRASNPYPAVVGQILISTAVVGSIAMMAGVPVYAVLVGAILTVTYGAFSLCLFVRNRISKWSTSTFSKLNRGNFYFLSVLLWLATVLTPAVIVSELSLNLGSYSKSSAATAVTVMVIVILSASAIYIRRSGRFGDLVYARQGRQISEAIVGLDKAIDGQRNWLSPVGGGRVCELDRKRLGTTKVWRSC
ncbi:hypothetical protein ABZX73_09320, partial [Brevibacterium casei]